MRSLLLATVFEPLLWTHTPLPPSLLPCQRIKSAMEAAIGALNKKLDLRAQIRKKKVDIQQFTCIYTLSQFSIHVICHLISRNHWSQSSV